MLSNRSKNEEEGPKKKKLRPLDLGSEVPGAPNQQPAPSPTPSTLLRENANFVRAVPEDTETYELASAVKPRVEAVPTSSDEILAFIKLSSGEGLTFSTTTELKQRLTEKLASKSSEELIALFKSGLDLLDRCSTEGPHAKLSTDPLRKNEDILRLATNAARELKYSLQACTEIFVTPALQIANAFVAEVLRRFERHPAISDSEVSRDVLREEIDRARVTFLKATLTGLKRGDREDESKLLHDPEGHKPSKPQLREEVSIIEEASHAEEPEKEKEEPKVEEEPWQIALREKQAAIRGGSAAYQKYQAKKETKGDDEGAANTTFDEDNRSGVKSLGMEIIAAHKRRMLDVTPTPAIKNLMGKMRDVKPQPRQEGVTRAGFISSDYLEPTEEERVAAFRQELAYNPMNGFQSWMESELSLCHALGVPISTKTVSTSVESVDARLTKIQQKVERARQQRDQIQKITTACVVTIAELLKPHAEQALGLSEQEQLRVIDLTTTGMARIRIEQKSHINEALWHDARRDARARDREIIAEREKARMQPGSGSEQAPPPSE